MRKALSVLAFALVSVLGSSCGDSSKQGAPPHVSDEPVLHTSEGADQVCDVIGRAGPQLSGGWTIVSRSSLLSSDRDLWNSAHPPGACPGLLELDLDGDGSTEFVVTAIQERGTVMQQKLSVFRRSEEGFSEHVVWGPEGVPFPSVIHTTTTQEVSDFYSGETSAIVHDAFVFERLEAWAIVYFEAEGKLRSVLVSD